MFSRACLYFKHLAVGTVLESPLRYLQYRLDYRRRAKTPGLENLAEEDGWIEQIVRQQVGQGSYCLDVGAHLGSMTRLFCRLTDPGHTDVVEADEQKANWIRNKFRGVRIHNVAVSDHTGEATFYIPMTKRGFSGLTSPVGAGDVREVKVPLTTIDEIIPANQPLDFIKMDVEGGELAALRGGRETIRRCQPTIVFECTRSGMDAFDYDSRDMWEMLTEDLGYRVFYLDDFLAKRPPTTFEGFCKAHTFPWRGYNFVAVAAQTPGVPQ